MSKLRLLQEAEAADQAWMAQVVQEFGAREAGMARFQGRAMGEPGSLLRELYDRYLKARDAYTAEGRCRQPPRTRSLWNGTP